MEINKMKLPFWLIHDDIKSVEKIDSIDYLSFATKLSIKNESLKNCFLKDSENDIFKIKGVEDLGPKNSLWKFEFFNPMRKINIVLVEVVDEESRRLIDDAINHHKLNN